MTTSTKSTSAVPGHIRTVRDTNYGLFCSREGQMAPGGRCPDGCDHAEHYSNDGHPECEDLGHLAASDLTSSAGAPDPLLTLESGRHVAVLTVNDQGNLEWSCSCGEDWRSKWADTPMHRRIARAGMVRHVETP